MPQAAHGLSSNRLTTFVWFFVAAFLIRIAVAWYTGHLTHMVRTEMFEIARSIAAAGEFGNPYAGLTGPTAHSTPPFPLLLAAIIATLKTADLVQPAISLLACAASALRCALVPLFVQDAGLGRGAVIGSGVLSTLYIGALQTEVGGALDGPYVAMSLLAILWMSLRLWRTASWIGTTPWTFFALCGFSTLLNPQVLPVIAGIVAAAFIASPAPWRKRLIAQSGLLAATIFVFLLPWGIRNSRELGSFILTRSNLGLELWLSNGPDRTYDLPGNYGRLHPTANTKERARVSLLGEVAYNSEKLNEASGWIRENPTDFARLTLRRAFAWWFPPGHWALSSVKWFLSLLALGGLVILWTRHRLSAALFAATWLTFPTLYYAIQWTSRMRYPMDWQLLVSAAVALHFLATRWLPQVQPVANDNDDPAHNTSAAAASGSDR